MTDSVSLREHLKALRKADWIRIDERFEALRERGEARALADSTALDVAVRATKTALEETATSSRKEFDDVRLKIEGLATTIAEGLAKLSTALGERAAEGVGAERLWERGLKLIGGLAGIAAVAVLLLKGAT